MSGNGHDYKNSINLSPGLSGNPGDPNSPNKSDLNISAQFGLDSGDHSFIIERMDSCIMDSDIVNMLHGKQTESRGQDDSHRLEHKDTADTTTGNQSENPPLSMAKPKKTGTSRNGSKPKKSASKKKSGPSVSKDKTSSKNNRTALGMKENFVMRNTFESLHEKMTDKISSTRDKDQGTSLGPFPTDPRNALGSKGSNLTAGSKRNKGTSYLQKIKNEGNGDKSESSATSKNQGKTDDSDTASPVRNTPLSLVPGSFSRESPLRFQIKPETMNTVPKEKGPIRVTKVGLPMNTLSSRFIENSRNDCSDDKDPLTDRGSFQRSPEKSRGEEDSKLTFESPGRKRSVGKVSSRSIQGTSKDKRVEPSRPSFMSLMGVMNQSSLKK